MWTNLAVFSQRPNVPTLPLGSEDGASDDPIHIRNIEGLGPVKATINTTPYASVDGESYSGSSVGKRDIVLTLGLNPNWGTQTIGELRTLLYAYFMPKSSVRLRFSRDDGEDVNILGYVESCEPNIFSDDPEMQVSITCPLPDFVGVNLVTVQGITDDGLSVVQFDYDGTVSSGFLFKIEATTGTPSYTGPVTLVSRTPYERSFKADPITIDTSNYLEISTIRGSKYIRNIRVSDKVSTNRLRSISPVAIWPVLEPGPNQISVVTTLSTPLDGQLWTITFYNKYGAL